LKKELKIAEHITSEDQNIEPKATIEMEESHIKETSYHGSV